MDFEEVKSCFLQMLLHLFHAAFALCISVLEKGLDSVLCVLENPATRCNFAVKDDCILCC